MVKFLRRFFPKSTQRIYELGARETKNAAFAVYYMYAPTSAEGRTYKDEYAWRYINGTLKSMPIVQPEQWNQRFPR